MDVARDARQVVREEIADLVLEHLERRLAVQPGHDVVAPLGHLVHRPDRRTTLGQAGGDGKLGGEQDTGHAAPGELAGNLVERAARRGHAADEKAAGVALDGVEQPLQRRVARIGVDHAEHRVATRRPGAHLGGQPVFGVGDGGQDAEAVARQAGGHHRHRRHVEQLFAGDADAEADGAHPVVYAGPLAQRVDDAAEFALHLIGDVDEPQAGVLRRADLRHAGLCHFLPAAARSMRHAEGAGDRVHAQPPPGDFSNPTTEGVMRSTMVAMPRALGWIPSARLSSGRAATPSRKNG